MARTGRLVVSGIRGRNGGDSPLGLPDWQAVEVLNMDFFEGELGRKRAGAATVALTSGPTVNSGSIFRHVPGNDETAAELWVFADAVTIYRLAGGTTWASVSSPDTVQSLSFSAASLNGKLFLAYNSNVNRLHCWDGTRIRRVGMAQGGTPTAANTGGGAYAHTLRYYKIAWVEKSGSVVIRRGELGPTLTYTPAVGALTAVRVTAPAVPSENETHWEVYASADDVYSNYRLIGTVVVATTTYDDSVEPANYSGDAPQSAGINIPPPSAKYIVSDGNRLLMTAAHETSAASGQTAVKNNRVWYTRVLGSSDQGDDETIPNTAAVGLIPAQKNWIDVGENDGGAVVGLGVLNGLVFVFKPRQVWVLSPTGDDLQPYRAVCVSRQIGASNHASIALGEDEMGAPAIYFMSYRGPSRITASGQIQYIGRDIEDYTLAQTGLTTAFTVFYPDKHQVKFALNSANNLFTFHPHEGRLDGDQIRGGWTRDTSPDPSVMFTAAGACLFSNTLGASMSLDLKPYYFGQTQFGSAALLKYDTGTTDGGTAFQAYIDSKPYFPAGIGMNVSTDDAALVAKAGSAVTIQLTIERDFGLETRTSTALLTAAGSETRVVKRFENSGLSQLGAVQFRLGDAAAASNAWTLDALSVPYTVQESRT